MVAEFGHRLRVLKTRGRSGRKTASRAEPECGPRRGVGVAGGPGVRDRLRRCRVRRAAPGADRRVVGAVRGVHAGARVSVLQGADRVGRWWAATTGSVVGYESWLERDWLMLLDFDPDVVGIAAQPFWLLWTRPEGKLCSHAPDYFARSAGGAALVMDCRSADRIKPRDADAFAVTRAACELVGWRYEVAGSPVPVVVGNVRWSSGYRHPRHDLPDVAAALQVAFAAPTGLMAGAESVGDPIAVLPAP